MKHLFFWFLLVMTGCYTPTVNAPMDIYVSGSADHSKDAHIIQPDKDIYLVVDVAYQKLSDGRPIAAIQEFHWVNPERPHLFNDSEWSCDLAGAPPFVPNVLLIVKCSSNQNETFVATNPVRCGQELSRDTVSTTITTTQDSIEVVMSCELR